MPQADAFSSSWPQTSLGQAEPGNLSQAWPEANVQSMEEALPKTESSRSLGSAGMPQVDSISSASWPQSRQAPAEPDASGVAWPRADMAASPSAQEELPKTESNLSLRGTDMPQSSFGSSLGAASLHIKDNLSLFMPWAVEEPETPPVKAQESSSRLGGSPSGSSARAEGNDSLSRTVQRQRSRRPPSSSSSSGSSVQALTEKRRHVAFVLEPEEQSPR
eukprot:TRINITY_DN9921_c0_g1_i9.p1 TRINITY_DN9921_c0_g1~~TRINITY_DN9921_c0_g1_i9.p1  ORF type:complete len:226 (-),score=45.18 TRINITY_DN9921_c0_g1_i9:226-882(-)